MYLFLEEVILAAIVFFVVFAIGAYLFQSYKRFRKHRKKVNTEPCMWRIKESLWTRLVGVIDTIIILILMIFISIYTWKLGETITSGKIPEFLLEIKPLYIASSWLVAVSLEMASGIIIWLVILIFFYTIDNNIIVPELEPIEPDIVKRSKQYHEYVQQQKKDEEEGWKEI